MKLDGHRQNDVRQQRNGVMKTFCPP